MTCIEGNFIFFLNYIVLHIISLLIFLLLNLILFQSNLTSGFKRLNWADLLGGRQKTFSWILMSHNKMGFSFFETSILSVGPFVFTGWSRKKSTASSSFSYVPPDEQQFHIFFFFNHINAVSLIFFRRTDGCSIEQEQHFPFFIFSSVNKKCSFRLRIPIREGVYLPQFGSGIAKVQK